MLQQFSYSQELQPTSAIGLCSVPHWPLKLQNLKIFLNNENMLTEPAGEMLQILTHRTYSPALSSSPPFVNAQNYKVRKLIWGG